MSASQEWQKFLKLFNSGKTEDALKFAKSMKDIQNKESALSFLKPSKSQKLAARKRIAARSTDKTVKAEIEKMTAHTGFMGNALF